MSNMKKNNLKNQEHLVSKVLVSELSNQRRSKAKTKERGDVSGGGKKPWRQKGTGRARAGSSRSPIWRGGGVVFGPTGNENHTKKVNKKERDAARRLLMESKKGVIFNVDLPKITKTKEAYKLVEKYHKNGRVLVLLANELKDFYYDVKRYFSNIPDLEFTLQENSSSYDIARSDAIIILGKKATKESRPTKKEGK